MDAWQPTELPVGSQSIMEEEFEDEARFRTYWYQRTPRHWLKPNLVPLDGVRDRPEVLRLEVEPGTTPNNKPVVRVFVGSEAGQSRVERVFIWSVMQTRDPARVYELYLMKDLSGYNRSAWKTGFSNYRYGIPAMTGGMGRAIYNNMNQIYLADPGELFDLDMGHAAVLSTEACETSVMLIDCERTSPQWSLEDAQSDKPNGYFCSIIEDKKQWGQLPAEWNVRAGKISAEPAKCIRFRTPRAQPWWSSPQVARHEPLIDSEIWLKIERAADAAGFLVFTKERPSRRYGEIVGQYQQLHEGGAINLSLPASATFDGHSRRKHQDEVLSLIQTTGSRSLLDFGAGKGSGYMPSAINGAPSSARINPAWPNVAVTCYDPGFEPFSNPHTGKFDGVICTDVLEHIPEEDIPWVLDELFRSANKFVYASAACYPARKKLPNGENAHVTQRTPAWWNTWFSIVARRYPLISWKLCSIERGTFGKTKKFSEGMNQITGGN